MELLRSNALLLPGRRGEAEVSRRPLRHDSGSSAADRARVLALRRFLIGLAHARLARQIAAERRGDGVPLPRKKWR